MSEVESEAEVETFCSNSPLENHWGNLKVFSSVRLDLQIFRFAKLFIINPRSDCLPDLGSGPVSTSVTSLSLPFLICKTEIPPPAPQRCCVITSDNETPGPVIPLSQLHGQLLSPLSNKVNLYIQSLSKLFHALLFSNRLSFPLSPCHPFSSKASGRKGHNPFLTSISPGCEQIMQHYKDSGVLRIKKSGRFFPPQKKGKVAGPGSPPHP